MKWLDSLHWAAGMTICVCLSAGCYQSGIGDGNGTEDSDQGGNEDSGDASAGDEMDDSGGDSETEDNETEDNDCVDGDGDTWCLPFDCNDADPLVYPGAEEIPGNPIDENCDGSLTEEGLGEDTEPVENCAVLDPLDYGDCSAWLGFGYNGSVCQSFSGCDCAPDCDQFYETAQDCAQACAAKGGCREDIFVYEDGEKRFDQREMCITSDWFDSVLAIELVGAHLECDTSVIHYCEPGETYCNPIVDDWDLVQQYPDYECAVSLIPGVTKLYIEVILK